MRSSITLCVLLLWCVTANCLNAEDTVELQRFLEQSERKHEESLVKLLRRKLVEQNLNLGEKRAYSDVQNESQMQKRSYPHILDFKDNVKRLWRDEERGPGCSTACPCRPTRKSRQIIVSERTPVPCCCP